MSRSAFLLILLLALSIPASAAEKKPFTPWQARALIVQAWTIARDHFFDPKMNGVDWRAQKDEALRACAGVHTRTACYRIINHMLDALHTSHTHLYGRDDAFYPYLISTFPHLMKRYPKDLVHGGKLMVEDAGIFPQETADGVFVQAVLDGGPAAQAGIHVGDRIVSIDGHPWHGITVWRGKAGKAVTVALQRVSGGPTMEVSVTPRLCEPQAALAAATRASVRVIERNGQHVGYVHAWAFTNDDVPAAVFQAMAGSLSKCDAIVLDLRDGLGGGSSDFMLPWLGFPSLTSAARSGQVSVSFPPPPRATVVLINAGTRSGKELYAYAFKSSMAATLVGARTEGAVVAGQAFLLKDGGFLYVAVARVSIDGHDLEGRGVEPDIAVARDIPWCNDADPQLERALAYLAPDESLLRGIDVFGTHQIDAATVKARFGDRMEEMARASQRHDMQRYMAIRQEIEHAIEGMGKFAYVRLSLIDYFPPKGQFMTVDVVDAGDVARRMSFAAHPTDAFPDPDGLLAAWGEYQAKGFALARQGKIDFQHLSNRGLFHNIFGFDDPDLAPYLERFRRGVRAHQQELVRILYHDRDDEHRAFAAFLLAYMQDGHALVRVLMPALSDSSELVRNNAMRVLAEISGAHAEIDIPVAPVADALHYPATTDRNKAAAILAGLAKRPACRAAILREGFTLLEMLRLQQPNNHDWAYIILCTLSGQHFGERDYAAWEGWLAQHGHD